MSSLNKATLIGRLTADPECRFTKSNTAVCNFSVATNERYKDKNGEWQESPEYHRCVAWGRTAEIVQEYLRKGSLVYIEGPIQTREWEDKDGNKKYTTEIKVLSMQMLDSKGNSGTVEAGNGKANSSATVDENFDDMDDDLPFIWLTPLLIPVSYLILNLI